MKHYGWLILNIAKIIFAEYLMRLENGELFLQLQMLDANFMLKFPRILFNYMIHLSEVGSRNDRYFAMKKKPKQPYALELSTIYHISGL